MLNTLAALHPDPAAAGAAGMLAAMGCVGIAVVLLLLMAFPVFCFWRIFTKAGWNGAMSLIWIIPGLGPLIVICILAFGEWPIHKRG